MSAPTSFHFRCNDEHRRPHRYAVCSRSGGLAGGRPQQQPTPLRSIQAKDRMKKDKRGRNHGGGYPKFKLSQAQRDASGAPTPPAISEQLRRRVENERVD